MHRNSISQAKETQETDLNHTMVNTIEPIKEDTLEESLILNTDLVVSHALLQTKYSLNPLDHDLLFKILDQNHENRKQYLETFIDGIMESIPVGAREIFRVDLLRYLVK